jgi:DNA-binding MarR family transcriptional regulator
MSDEPSTSSEREASAPIDAALVRDAEAIEQHLRVIRRLVRGAMRADMQAARLTHPQMQALEAIVRHGGIGLKALSRHLALAHSTVSSIVDRLEGRGMVRREVDPRDRRGIRILPSDAVTLYLERELPRHRLGPLLRALHGARDEERTRVLTGIETLRRLLEREDGATPEQ